MACGATAIYQLTRNALAITREGLTILRDDEGFYPWHVVKRFDVIEHDKTIAIVKGCKFAVNMVFTHAYSSTIEPEWLLPKGGESESGSGMGEIGLVLPEVRSWTPQRLAVRLNELLAECRCK
jgi:hypothetical protein